MIYTVRDITLRGKERVIEQRARISLDESGIFIVMDADGEVVVFDATRARVDRIAVTGLVIGCMIGAGYTKTGIRRYEYREIYCAYEVAK